MEFKHLSCCKSKHSEVSEYLDKEINKLSADGWVIDQSIMYPVVVGGLVPEHFHCAFVRMKKV